MHSDYATKLAPRIRKCIIRAMLGDFAGFAEYMQLFHQYLLGLNNRTEIACLNYINFCCGKGINVGIFHPALLMYAADKYKLNRGAVESESFVLALMTHLPTTTKGAIFQALFHLLPMNSEILQDGTFTA